ncbi:MAG TPA: AMP-binding protein [Acidimicrobiales bacterium]|nr:AMP-binding protein [Acidimicrobiales bacterium]
MPDLVAIDMAGGPAFVAALTQAWEEGDAVLPVDQRLPEAARAGLLDVMAPAIVVDGDGRHRRRGGQPVDAGDALVMATSGTTGLPKGVVLTHDAVEASARATSARLGVDPARHRWLACLPLNHVGGMSVVTRALITGTALTVLPGYDAVAVGGCAGADVMVSLVATALRRTPADLFGKVVLGGSVPPADLPDNVVTTYGLTETGSGVVYDGLPLDGVEVEIDGSGEIRLRGPMLLRSYRDGTVPLETGGWLRTGDAGSIGAEGRLVVQGRIGDLIITGGENVWPVPVEDAIRAHPAVADVAVAGRPDPEWGQRVVAWIVVASGARPPALDEIRDLVGSALPRFAAPRQLVLTDALPRTAIGKISRSELAIDG